MNILMCNKFNFIKGGAERYLFDLKSGLRRLGHSVIDFSVLSPRNEYSEYSAYFVKEKAFSSPIAALDFIYSFEASRKIGFLIDKFKPDVAHIHNIYHQISSSILYTLRRKKVPVVMTLHDYKLICPNYSLFSGGNFCQKCKSGGYYNAFARKCLKNSYMASFLVCLEMYITKLFKVYESSVALFIAPSKFMLNKAVEFGIDKRKISYLPYAIDLEQFSPGALNGGYILYFGDISEKKGVASILDCARQFPGTAIKIAGDGSDKDKYEHYCSDHGLKNVEFLGYKTRPELIPVIRGALFVVVPSKWPEVCGLVIYESFSCGKCVIASNIGGIPEFVEDKSTGLLFQPENQRDYLDKVDYLLRYPEERRRLGDNAREKIAYFNNRSRHYQELIKIYESCPHR